MTCATARSRASSAPTRGGSTRSSSTRTKDLFATASEDAHVSVWKIPDEQARLLKHVATLPLPDHVLTGVAFCGGGGRELVAATAYDVDYISAWALDA